MNDTKMLWNVSNPPPTVIGTGLLTLDAVINHNKSGQPQFWAGGSCGNVMTILSYLGWQAYPIVRLGNDANAKILKNDIKRFGVHLEYIFTEPETDTPIIIEKIYSQPNTTRTHRFLLTCPTCGYRLPRYKPVLSKQVDELLSILPRASVFYFDRLSRGAAKLAEEFIRNGALVMFEPVGFRDKKLFGECLKSCHILKYQKDSFVDPEGLNEYSTPPLVVETMGAKGLRFRYRKKDGKPSKWCYMKAYPVEELKDTAGAGDWCTAGLLHVLGQQGAKRFLKAKKEDFIEALNFGQALASLKCRFESPRGLMYSLTKTDLITNVEKIMKNQHPEKVLRDMISQDTKEFVHNICPACNQV